MRHFVIKVRDHLHGDRPDYRKYEFDWTNDYFRPGGTGKLTFMSSEAPLSRLIMRDELEMGNIGVCYQTDSREIRGFVRFESVNLDDWSFEICSAHRALELPRPVTINEIRECGCSPRCFKPGNMGTLFRLSLEEFRGICDAIIKCMTELDQRVFTHWLEGNAKACP